MMRVARPFWNVMMKRRFWRSAASSASGTCNWTMMSLGDCSENAARGLVDAGDVAVLRAHEIGSAGLSRRRR